MIQPTSPSKRYIGIDKPVVEYHIQRPDPYYWQRRTAALKLNYEEDELNDYPERDNRMDVDQE